MPDATTSNAKRTARPNASPRRFEATLLLGAAAILSAVRSDRDENGGGLDQAVRRNRHLWSIFVASVTRADDPLPAEIRHNVANLELFVVNETAALLADRRPERLDPLIAINCELAAGLLGRC